MIRVYHYFERRYFGNSNHTCIVGVILAETVPAVILAISAGCQDCRECRTIIQTCNQINSMLHTYTQIYIQRFESCAVFFTIICLLHHSFLQRYAYYQCESRFSLLSTFYLMKCLKKQFIIYCYDLELVSKTTGQVTYKT